ncbi:hypothetical protein J6590_065746 [Homalodisca vitripennis]|nr:hypothetical protein J6590_065746 [Homalodisca vitripennis]
MASEREPDLVMATTRLIQLFIVFKRKLRNKRPEVHCLVGLHQPHHTIPYLPPVVSDLYQLKFNCLSDEYTKSCSQDKAGSGSRLAILMAQSPTIVCNTEGGESHVTFHKLASLHANYVMPRRDVSSQLENVTNHVAMGVRNN